MKPIWIAWDELTVSEQLSGTRLVDKDPGRRWIMAHSLATPLDVLELLAQDKNEYVRREVAWNPNTTTAILLQLANDPHPIVRKTVQARVEALSEQDRALFALSS